MKKTIFAGSMLVLLSAFGAGAATLSGTVRAPAEGGPATNTNPLPGAKIVLIRVSGGGNTARLDSTVTNANGQYTFSDVSTGFRSVEASKPGFVTGTAFANIQGNNGTYTANVTLQRTGGSSNNLGAVAGTVRVGTTPVPNATVILSRPVSGRPDMVF